MREQPRFSKPSREFRRTIDIAADPRSVWNVLADIERWPQWNPSMESVRLIDPAPIQKGSRILIKQQRLASARMTVARWAPDQGFVWRTGNALLAAVASHEVVAAGQGASVSLTIRFEGLLSGLCVRRYAALIEQYLDMEAKGLKRRSELCIDAQAPSAM